MEIQPKCYVGSVEKLGTLQITRDGKMLKLLKILLYDRELSCWHPVKMVAVGLVSLMALFATCQYMSLSDFRDASPRVQRCCTEKCMAAKSPISCKIDCIEHQVCQ